MFVFLLLNSLITGSISLIDSTNLCLGILVMGSIAVIQYTPLLGSAFL